MKTCTGCGEEKPLDAFYLDKRWDIPRSRCKPCSRPAVRKKQPNTPAKDAARARWEAKHPEWRRKYQREYHRRNAEKINARRRKGGKHYGRVVADRHIRRARLAQAPGRHTAEEWEALKVRYDHRCLCCGESKALVRDHVIPLVEGGSNDIDNIQPLCRSCNAKKGTAVIDYRDVCEVPQP